VNKPYVHGYHPRENERLQDQAGTLVDLLMVSSATRSSKAWARRGNGDRVR